VKSYSFSIPRVTKAIVLAGYGFGYATQRLMGLIDNDRKIYYCPLKSNRAR
jgi:L-asparaginase/Glu-tRNA(Gln) amidotransferase subunit D